MKSGLIICLTASTVLAVLAAFTDPPYLRSLTVGAACGFAFGAGVFFMQWDRGDDTGDP